MTVPAVKNNPMVLSGSEKPVEGRCGRKIRKSDPARYCMKYPVKGWEVCRDHGANGGRPIETGLHSKRLAQLPAIQERVDELRADPRLLDGREQLALVLSILENTLASLSPKSMSDPDTLRLISTTVNQTQKTIESIHKIQVGHYLSPEHVQEQIQRASAIIQRQCKGCDKLPLLAAEMQSKSSKDKG